MIRSSPAAPQARILKSLHHAHIIRFYDVFETEAELCLLVALSHTSR